MVIKEMEEKGTEEEGRMELNIAYSSDHGDCFLVLFFFLWIIPK